MRNGWIIALVFLGVFAVSFTSVHARDPNVVVFYADDLGWGDLSVYNQDPAHFRHTPNIDKIFNQGIRFDNYVTHCVCSPSRAGLLTGKHYAKVAAGPATGGTLPNDIRNVAKDFQAAGYKTGAFGKWHNGMPNFPEDGNGQRFDYNKDRVWSELHREFTCDLANGIFDNHKGWEWGDGVNAYGFDRWVGYYNGGGDLFDRYVDWHHDIDWWHDKRYVPDEEGYTTDLITKHATDFIRQNKALPFFCYIPHEAVHNPLQVKLTDLKSLCRHLPGQWQYVRKIESPTTGRRIEEVAEIRCDSGAEFDAKRIDPNKEHFQPLIYATYLFSLDQSVGRVMEQVVELGLTKNTIFMFTADNGATPDGCNLPYRGSKHTLWEGGIHVPAAIWWPGTFDAETAPYASEKNSYTGPISYLDVYPTLLSMTGQRCLGTELDGTNRWPGLKNNSTASPAMANPNFWMWDTYGAIRTNRWKLMYSESTGQAELYDLQADIGEQNDVANAHPDIRKSLTGAYKRWIADNRFAVSYLPASVDGGDDLEPEPAGDVLEIKARQTATIQNGFRDGVYLRLDKADGWGEALGKYIEPGDRLQYDLYLCEDSDISSGISYCPGKGWNPFFHPQNGLNQDGVSPQQAKWPKGTWIRQTVGVGNMCPHSMVVSYIALQNRNAGYYHFYLDNVVVRRSDGSVRKVIWASKQDSGALIIRHRKKNYGSLADALSSKGFPFGEIEIDTVQAAPLIRKERVPAQ
jgi:arylsulfatase A-like enzyme